MKTVFIILIVMTSFLSFGQLTESNKGVLRTELSRKVNFLRSSLGLQSLLTSDVLKKSAVFHSEYMAKHKELTHKQNKTKYSSPKKRVLFMKGDNFEIVGENVLFSKEQEFPLKKKELVLLANEMFEQWKNSPPHYANMIDPEYTYGDFGFKTSGDKAVFATQVFGKKGVVVDNQLSENSFGLTVAPKSCDDEFTAFSNLILNMGNAISIEDGEIKFYHSDLNRFDKIFTSETDGLAIDIIKRKQVDCKGPNQLDFSPIYDGVLIKPIYKNNLLSNNEAEGDYRLITSLGALPQSFLGEDISVSVILIKDGKMCKYLVPTAVPRRIYQLRTVFPKLTNPEKVSFIDTGIVDVQELVYNFAANKKTPLRKPSIKDKSLTVSSIKILSYSSIEGDSIHNFSLQKARGKAIMRHIKGVTSTPDSIYQIISRENWQKMNYQFHYYNKEHFAELSRDSIKFLASKAKDDSLPWGSLLFEQRESSASIHYSGIVDTSYTYSATLDINLRTAAIQELPSLANKALFETFYDTNFHEAILFEKDIWMYVTKEPKVVANYAAVLSQEFSFDIQKSTQFLFNWIYKSDQLNDDAKYNLLHLYTLLGNYFLDEWDVASERLANVVHPIKLHSLESKNIESELVLNLHLTYIKYFGQINDGPNINKSFHFIANHFKENITNENDDVDLSLFFNYWSMYHMTKDLLIQRYKSQKINENGVFILAKTLSFDSDGVESNFYEQVQLKASELNPTRWCEWLTNDFQVLRNHKIKRLFCANCNDK